MVGREALKEEFLPASASGGEHDSAFNHIDVVAVQGLASNYETTWTAYDEGKRPCMWLRDLLPLDLPAVRIQTFRYDSRWYDDPDYVSLRECGKRLLYALIADRTHRGQCNLCPTRRKRPLILVGHSFGGLVVNQCLVIASQVKPDDGDFRHKDCQDLLKAVSGIVYLGVPHRGSNFAKWGIRKSWLGGLIGKQSYPANLQLLAIESTTLEALREDFTKLAKSRTLNEIELFCFYETKGIQLGIVVEDGSACLDFAPSDSLAANHFEMNKFLPGENYRKLMKRLQNFCESAPSIVKRRYEWETYSSPRARPEYQRVEAFLAAKADLQSQALDQLISRRDPDTCNWTEQHEVLSPWSNFLDPANLAWMHGIPGSGKSVLAAAIVEDCEIQNETETECWHNMSNELCAVSRYRHNLASIAYYFAGFSQETFVCPAILSILVHQCLVTHSDHHVLLRIISEIVLRNRTNVRRRTSVLVDMLGEIARHTGGIRIVIDGFNELRGWTEVIDILSKFQSNKAIRVLFIGHPNDQPIGSNLDMVKNDGMAFDISQYTKEDIRSFVHKKVSHYIQKWPNQEALGGEVEQVLLGNSQGMYQWVSLVLDVIDRYGESTDEARRALVDFPTGLQAMYIKVFEKLADRPQKMLSRIRAALVFLSVNLNTVTLQDLHEYVQACVEPADIRKGSNVDDDEATELAVKSLRESLGSLVVVHPASSRLVAPAELGQKTLRHDTLLVELCHSSLRQLILKEAEPTFGSHDEQLIRPFTSTIGLAHKDAAIVCLQVATRSFKSLVCFSYYSIKAHEPPMVHYAYQYWFSHLVASDFADADDVHTYVQEFRRSLIQDSARLIGSISLVTRSDVVGLGPNSGGIPKTAGLVALQSSLLQAASAIQSLSGVPFAPAYHSGHGLNNEDPSHLSLGRRCKAYYHRWKRQNYLSSIAAEISKINLVPTAGDLNYEEYVDCSLQAVQSLQMLALELSMNPIRWPLLNPRQYFSPVVPFLIAAHSLESLMLWPANKYLKIASIGPWNASEDSRLHKQLSCAVTEMQEEPSEKEIRRRLREAEKIYTLRGVNAATIAAYVSLNQGSGLVRSLKAPLFNYWLNTRVHVRSQWTRGHALLFGSPELSLSRSYGGTVTEYDEPRIMDAVFAFPNTLALFLAAVLRQILQPVSRWAWLALKFNYERIRSAYTNYSLIPILLWNHYRPYIVPGFALYLLRCKYWPTLGQHWRPDAYRQIQLSIVAPLNWIAEQSDWTWWEWIQYQVMYWIMMALTTAHPSVPETWPVLRESTKVLMALQLFLIVERTACQIVNAVLTLTVPILLLIQPETTVGTLDPVLTFHELVWRPLTDASLTMFLIASTRMVAPVIVIYYSNNAGLLSKLVEPYIISVILPISLTFSALVLSFVTKLLVRPTIHKEPGEAFLLSLVLAAAIFVIIHVERQIENDPWRLDVTWRGYKQAAKMAQQITGREIMSLQAEIDRHRVHYQGTNNTEALESTEATSVRTVGPSLVDEDFNVDVRNSRNSNTEASEELLQSLLGAKFNKGFLGRQKDKDV